MTPEERREALNVAADITFGNDFSEREWKLVDFVLSFGAALSAVEQERDEHKAGEFLAAREVERLKAQLAEAHTYAAILRGLALSMIPLDRANAFRERLHALDLASVSGADATGVVAKHIAKVWRRVSEGSAQAECSCGWRGPKRTYEGKLAHEDALNHVRDAVERVGVDATEETKT